MSFDKQLGQNYRISAVDAENAHRAIVAYFVNHEPWTDELEFAELCLFADEMHRKSGDWPTLSECIAAWNKR